MMCYQLANAANHSLSRSTWSMYKTVKTHLERCQIDLNVRFSFPMSNNQVLCFIAWLLKRNLSATTINSYISGLRTIHLVKGLDNQALRQPIVTAIIEGKAHLDIVKNRLQKKSVRMPITINLLKLIKATINAWEESDKLRLLVWSVCLICFLEVSGFMKSYPTNKLLLTQLSPCLTRTSR